MYFENIKFYLENSETGEMKIKFICNDCGEETDKPYNYEIPCDIGGITKVWEAKYWCEKCHKKIKANAKKV